MMPSQNELPAKCMECARSEMSRFHGKCHFCRDLNRCVQSRSDFECHAFQPMLKLAGPSKNKVPRFDDNSIKNIKEKLFLDLLNSDKIKYERALALQKLARDPDGVYVQLKLNGGR